MKPKEDVISDFNKVVNMTASELKAWLKSDNSNSAGWPKDDGSGESVGHDSGRKIVEILENNPDKEPDKYTDEDVEHMRRVVAYCKRHLAQETKANKKKTPEEIKNTKSWASLKNWGHDYLKAEGAPDGGKDDEPASEESKEKEEDAADQDEEEGEEETKEDGVDDEVDHHEKEEHVGEKRKPSEKETKPSKKRETRKGSGGEPRGGEITKGDTVTWKWGKGHPEGKVLDVKEDTAKIKSKNDNTITRHGRPDDPAVVLDTGKSKAVKLSHEVERED